MLMIFLGYYLSALILVVFYGFLLHPRRCGAALCLCGHAVQQVWAMIRKSRTSFEPASAGGMV